MKISGKDGIKNVEEKYVTHLIKTLTLLEKFEMKVILVNYNKIEYVVEKSINLNLERLQKINTLLNKETIIYSYAKYFQNHYTNNLLQLLFTEATGVTDYKIKREMTRINQD